MMVDADQAKNYQTENLVNAILPRQPNIKDHVALITVIAVLRIYIVNVTGASITAKV